MCAAACQMQHSLLPGPCHQLDMQRLACSCPSRVLLHSRALAQASPVASRAAAGGIFLRSACSEAVHSSAISPGAGGAIDAEVVSGDAGKPSVKNRIQSVLSSLDKPVSSNELWELCQARTEHLQALVLPCAHHVLHLPASAGSCTAS